MRIDLHTHSSVSDGTESPAELLGDRPRGGARRRRPDRPRHHRRLGDGRGGPAAGLTVVPGMELSCRWFPSDQPPISVHLLAYLFDPLHPGFAAERARLRDERLDRGERIVAALAAAGYPVAWDSRSSSGSDGGVVGRPHIAQRWSTPAPRTRSTTRSPRCCTTAARTT